MRQGSRQSFKFMDSVSEYLRCLTTWRLPGPQLIIFLYALKCGGISNLGGGTVAVHE
jgi:hypothetical protein